MTTKEDFEKFITELDFQDIAHDTESIRNLYLRAWQAATTEANKRIAGLESEVAELKVDINEYIKISGIQASEINELQASNNRLRDALETCDTEEFIQWDDEEGYVPTPIKKYRKTYDSMKVQKALSTTPAESLQAFENDVIEKCAKVCDEYLNSDYPECAKDIQDEIRALKEVK